MQILITNNTLAGRAGTELYVRDLALGLLERGHQPFAFSTRLGDVASELTAAGVTVTDDLDSLTVRPDIIHGHHHLDTMTALLHFPGTPAIYVCHGSTPWEEAAPRFPRILGYVAVDHACLDRLVLEDGIPEDRIRVLLNFVDLQKFKQRPALPERPQRALIFSNNANDNTHTEAIRSACDRVNISVDVVGKAVGNASREPEAMLGNYDLVFAKGRAALEALAVGTAVILCDAAGAGPMVTSENLPELRPLNFGLRALREELSSEVISREIARYDPRDAEHVSQVIRADAGREAVLDELITLYRDVIQEYEASSHDPIAEQQAASRYLRGLSPRLKSVEDAVGKETAARINEMEKELKLIKNSRGWRLISRYSAIKHKLLLPTYGRARGVFRR